MARDIWSMDEYIVVADLYLRRGRSSGVGDPEVVELSDLTGRSPASISRRLGNFDGTDRPGRGLKPVTGDALAMFVSMRADTEMRLGLVDDARRRLESGRTPFRPVAGQASPRFVDPEAFVADNIDFLTPAAARRIIRAEARLVERYRAWLDPRHTRLKSVLIPASGRVLRADLYDTQLGLLIEAKGAVRREHIRLAVGQLIDYRRYLDPAPGLAVLLPQKPPGDLLGLPLSVGIDVIWADEHDRFVGTAGGTDRSGEPADALGQDGRTLVVHSPG